MWCGRKGIDCAYCSVFGECKKSACGLPDAMPSTLTTSSSYLVNTTTEKSMDDIKREAVKEFAEKVKDYLEDKLIDEFGDGAVDTTYLTIDIDEFEDYVDELLKEYEQ